MDGSFSLDPATAGSLVEFRSEILQTLPPECIEERPLRRLAYGTDASLYRLTPQIVLEPKTEDHITAILKAARVHNVGLTFRAGGTSLAGQAVTDSVLVRIGRSWAGMKVVEDGARIDTGPAAIGGHVNAALNGTGRRFGPDPASVDSAHVGGIVANNAGGMVCGTTQTSYATVSSMRIMLANGAVLDTADPESRAAFAQSHAALLDELAKMRREILENTPLADRINRKFSIKNTCGYSLNSLLDYEDPVDMLLHLMVGSEGTLGFMSRVRFDTVPDPALKSTAMVFFPTMRAACEVAPMLEDLPVDAAELMDRASLRSVEGRPGIPESLSELGDEVAALLIETRADDADALARRRGEIEAAFKKIETVGPVEFSEDPDQRQKYWAVRKGAFPSAGAMRPPGTSVIIEDICVPIDQLPEATAGLRDLCNRHGYPQSIIWGHALAGNVHFVITPDFSVEGETERYDELMNDLADLIVNKHDGSLKGEHGTGRNMAPFVEMEWGSEAYGYMKRIKALLDPDGILNPGVLMNDDPQVHLNDIKTLPAADPTVDKCIECGFCEPVCPSRGYTLTPRQRIVGMREMARLKETGEDPEALKNLKSDYQFDGINTCAVDSLCAKACPVGIDTGAAMKQLRAESHGPVANWVAARVGRNFSAVATGVSWALSGADLLHKVLGTRAMGALCGTARKVSGDRIPLWTPAMPRGGTLTPVSDDAAPDAPRVVYIPSCASRAMGSARGDPESRPLTSAVVSVLEKAGYKIVYPDLPGRLCCGQPFSSKGLNAEADRKRDELLDAVRDASRGGKDPIVFDTSPCAFRALTARQAGLQLYDLPDFLHDHVMPRLDITPVPEAVALHATCSTLKRDAEGKLEAVTRACAGDVVRPTGINCCGWSGDRGFTFPDLNANALAELSGKLPETVQEGISSSRTCEIGLSNHSGRPYRSIAYLVDRASRPRA